MSCIVERSRCGSILGQERCDLRYSVVVIISQLAFPLPVGGWASYAYCSCLIGLLTVVSQQLEMFIITAYFYAQ